MRWFAGTSGSHSAPRPDRSTVVWDGPDPLWLVGDWPQDEVRVLSRGNGGGQVRMAVLGDCRATDAELEVGLAVARGGGLRPLTTWPGSYHVVLRLGRRTLVLGDLAGLRQVYHTPFEDGVVYASHALPLADLTGARLDRDLLAARILCPEVPELTAGRSLFGGIDRLEVGHTLELAGAKVRLRLHEQHAAPLDFPAAAAALRESLTAAVGRRVEAAAKAGTDLSGGRDSTVLSLLAARAAAQREVVAVTWADPSAQDDVDYATRVVTSSARLRHLLVSADPDFLPYSGLVDAFQAPPATDDPASPLVTTARTLRHLEVAREAGIDIHLTGYGGDAVLGTPLAYLADLAMDRHPVTAMRHARAWARVVGVRPGDLAAAARRVGRTAFPDALTDLAAFLERDELLAAGTGFDALISWVAPAPAVVWSTPDARHRVADALRRVAGETTGAADRPGDPTVHGRPGDRASWVAVRRAADRHRVMQQLAEGSGVRMRAPYLDNAVVRAGLALPAWARGRGDGPRTLLHTAVEGLVPRSALSRTGKGDYTRSEIRGLRRNAADLRDLFAAPLLGEIGVLDTGTMRAALDRATRPVLGKGTGADPAELLGGFADVVAAELWLRGVAAGRAVRWGSAATAGGVIAAVA